LFFSQEGVADYYVMHTTRIYTCFAAILCLSAVISAEPPVSSNRDKPIVSQRLFNRVADIIANGGDGSSRGSDGAQENEGSSIVDQELLNRIARIISQNDGQLSWSQKGHGGEELDSPTNENEISYGVPPVEAPAGAKELAGTPFELSPPEPVPRIASFDFTDDDDSSFSPQRDSYSDNGNLYRGSDKLQLGEPETALRIASFDIEGEQPPLPYTPPQGRAQSGYSTLRSS